MVCFCFSESKIFKQLSPEYKMLIVTKEIHHLFLGFKMDIPQNDPFC